MMGVAEFLLLTVFLVVIVGGAYVWWKTETAKADARARAEQAFRRAEQALRRAAYDDLVGTDDLQAVEDYYGRSSTQFDQVARVRRAQRANSGNYTHNDGR